jgi:sec-independent protein translocase protein TatB
MFDIGYAEILVIAVVALVVIGPKDLPRVMRTVGQWVGRARGMARHFRSGVDTMIREAELEEMEKKWRDENERIMRDHPAAAGEAWSPVTQLPGPDTMSQAAYGDVLPTGTDETAPNAPLTPPDEAPIVAHEEEVGEQDPRDRPPPRQPGEPLP